MQVGLAEFGQFRQDGLGFTARIPKSALILVAWTAVVDGVPDNCVNGRFREQQLDHDVGWDVGLDLGRFRFVSTNQ